MEAAGEASEPAQEFLECGLCFENDELKRLPCNPDHIYCITCLTKDSEQTEILKCPLCRTVFDERIDDIPSAGAPLDKFLCCDVCMRKDDKRRLAQIYCVICQKKFCTPHEKSHNDALDDHRRIRMDEYKRDYRRLETRYCQTHKKKSYSLCCEKCKQVFCTDCVNRMSNCSDGEPHCLISLEMLVTLLKDLVNEKKVWIYDKEEHLLGMSKQLTAIISDWDTETQRMIDKLHKARDEQVRDLELKYKELETKLVDMRSKAKSELTAYLDDEIGSKLDKLSRQLAKVDVRVFTYHEVDVADGYRETEILIDELVKLYVKPFEPSANHVQLCESEETNVLPFEIVRPAEDIRRLINFTSSLTPPPKKIELLKEIHLDCTVHCVDLQDDNVTYVGKTNCAVAKVTELVNSNLNIKTDRWVSGVQVYGNRIYTLIHDYDKNHVVVYDRNEEKITSWNHFSHSTNLNKLVVVAGRVVVPSGKTQTLTVYTTEGRLVKEIECCGMISDEQKGLAVCGDDSVIVSDYSSSRVFRVNIDSDDVMWASKHVTRPQGVVCYKNRYVLVTNYNTDTRIWILDADTGKLVGEMYDEEVGWYQHYDLSIYGDTLIVTNSVDLHGHPSFLRYYKLHTESD